MNHSLVDAAHPGPYTDSPMPRVFGNVSPLDPQLFYRINDFADELLKGERSGKYTPIEVAQWLEDYSATATASWRAANASDRKGPPRISTTDHRHRGRGGPGPFLRRQVPYRRPLPHLRADRRPRRARRVAASYRAARTSGPASSSGPKCLRGRHHRRRDARAARSLGRPAGRHRRRHRLHGREARSGLVGAGAATSGRA